MPKIGYSVKIPRILTTNYISINYKVRPIDNLTGLTEVNTELKVLQLNLV
jgi:hypothetical protein